MNKKLVLAFALLCLLQNFNAMSIVQPLQDDTNDPFNITGYGLNLDGYESALLRLALSYDNQSTQVSRYPTWLPRGREFSMMNDGVAIDVVWGSATKDRFESYSAVKIPIYKGLIGWRMALVKTSRLEQFAAVKSISDLRQFIPGQHRNWSDYKIFSANQLDITSGANRGALAQMLVLDRIDYFPRAVIEMNKELRDFAHLDIAFEPYILIRYKSAYVFYVAKSNTFLKHIIEKGLHQAQNDGSFDALFKQHFGAELASFSLDKRRVIELHNPLLPEEMLEIEESMWISPKAFK